MGVRDEAVQKSSRDAVSFLKKKPEELSENTRFVEDLGARSGNVSQMTNFLEDEFDVEISFMEFRRRATIGMAADYIEELCEE